jgi:hypothetical protein
MKYLLPVIAALLFAPIPAQAQHVIKDSLYFTLDDGLQSPEEMEEESLYVHSICQGNTYQSLYFNCDCIAGAFLAERERVGPTVMQYDIVRQLLYSRKATCANTEQIAGTIYKDCMDYANYSRELETDNEEYCTCAANKTASDFERMPRLSSRYIRQIRGTALSYCRQPSNRARYVSSKTKTGNLLSSSPTP